MFTVFFMMFNICQSDATRKLVLIIVFLFFFSVERKTIKVSNIKNKYANGLRPSQKCKGSFSGGECPRNSTNFAHPIVHLSSKRGVIPSIRYKITYKIIWGIFRQNLCRSIALCNTIHPVYT